MKLYVSLTSPYARKVRMVVAERGLDCPVVPAELRAEASPVQRLSPLGKVPLLELDDGTALYDSPVIVEYLDAHPDAKGQPVLPSVGPARWAALRWQALADGCADAAVARMFELRRPAEQQAPSSIAWEERRIARALDAMDAGATAARGGFLVDDRVSIADLAVASALGYIDLRYAHPWRERHPALAAWFASIGARPAVRETAPPA
jgi:glutathione S-transferase